MHNLTTVLAEGIRQLGHSIKNDTYFDTLSVELSYNSDEFLKNAETQGINVRKLDARTVCVSLDETTSKDDMYALLKLFAKVSAQDSFHTTDANYKPVPDVEDLAARLNVTLLEPKNLPEQLRRTSPYLTHPVFNSFHSETEMLRYISRLQSKDLSLANTMIPLGSCTMKLNATTEMIPVSWPEFSNIHPFVPMDQVDGYKIMLQVRMWGKTRASSL